MGFPDAGLSRATASSRQKLSAVQRKRLRQNRVWPGCRRSRLISAPLARVIMIPFNSPYLPEASFRYLREAVENRHLSGDGPFTRKCHEWLECVLGTPKALLTTSCTHALEM